MLGGAVADVGLPAVAGIPRRQPLHETVAHRLGENRRGGHRVATRVAVHQRLVRVADLGKRQAVDQDAIGAGGADPAGGAAVDRAAHRERGRDPDVEPIDLAARGGADRRTPAPAARIRLGELPAHAWAGASCCREARAPPWHPGGNTTAAATTGPASGPRPASSTPTRSCSPAQATRSRRERRAQGHRLSPRASPGSARPCRSARGDSRAWRGGPGRGAPARPTRSWGCAAGRAARPRRRPRPSGR